jgi:hypothetical protein
VGYRPFQTVNYKCYFCQTIKGVIGSCLHIHLAERNTVSTFTYYSLSCHISQQLSINTMSILACNYPIPLKTGKTYLHFKPGVSILWPTGFFVGFCHIYTLRIYHKICQLLRLLCISLTEHDKK